MMEMTRFPRHWCYNSDIENASFPSLEQNTSGNLEACRPLWPCCWSDATAPTSYATVIMMRYKSKANFIWLNTLFSIIFI